MDKIIMDIFGQGKDLEWYQMMARSFTMFFFALVLIRLGGLRIFGKKSSFDEIVSVMLGALLSRGITGTIPFFSAVASGTALIIVHRIVAMLCIKYKMVEILVKGRKVILFEKGTIIPNNLTKCSLTKMDLMESLRLVTNKKTLDDDVETAYMENNGSISFILKKEAQ